MPGKWQHLCSLKGFLYVGNVCLSITVFKVLRRRPAREERCRAGSTAQTLGSFHLPDHHSASVCFKHRVSRFPLRKELSHFMLCCILCSVASVSSVVSDSLWPHGLQPARLLCPQNSLSRNTGVGCHSLLQGIFLTQGSNPGLLHCRQILYCLSHQGSPVENTYKDLIHQLGHFNSA